MAARRGRNELDGHAFAGWVTARELSDEDRELVETIEEFRPGRDWSAQKALDERQAAVEGDILPTCECGWKGLAEDWQPRGSRSSTGGRQFLSHEFTVRSTAATERLAAEVAAAALRHAVDDWDGDESVAEWLEARAEHIEDVGRYDAETWPTSE